MQEIIINGQIYLKKDSEPNLHTNQQSLIVRTSSGIFIGYIESNSGHKIVINNLRKVCFCTICNIDKEVELSEVIEVFTYDEEKKDMIAVNLYRSVVDNKDKHYWNNYGSDISYCHNKND